MSGDTLARGARRATFGPVKFCSQKKWDAIFEDEPKEEIKNESLEVPKEKVNGERL